MATLANPPAESPLVDRSPMQRWLRGAVTILWISAYASALAPYVASLWQAPHYRFFPIAISLAVWLLSTRSVRRRHPLDLPLSVILPSLAILFLSALLAIPLFAAISLVWLAVWYAILARTPTSLSLWQTGLLFLVCLRPPGRIDYALITTLQTQTTQFASLLLESCGLYHFRQGNVLQFPNRGYFVEEACSGVQGLFALLFVAAAIAAIRHRPLLWSILLLASTYLWAGLMNILRVFAVAYADQTRGIDLSTGWQHETLGFVVLGIAMLLVVGTDRILALMLDPIDWDDGSDILVSVGKQATANPFLISFNALARLGNASYPTLQSEPTPGDAQPPIDLKSSRGAASASRRKAILITVAAMVILILQTPLVWRVASSIASHQDFDIDRSMLCKESLPASYGDFSLDRFDRLLREHSNENGRLSDVWTYRAPTSMATVAHDQLFYGWHELTSCYTSVGWELVGRETHTDLPWGFCSAEFVRPTGEHGYLWFSLYGLDGTPLNPPESTFWPYLTARLSVNQELTRVALAPSLQSQLFLVSVAPIDDATRQQAGQFHLQSRDQMKQGVLAAQRAKP
jgi:exosortase